MSCRNVAAALAAFVCVGAVAAGPASAEPAVRPAAVVKLVPVWVLVDGDTPVRGGDVRIYTGDLHAGSALAPVRARALRLRTGAREERTSASGEALLELGRLPHNFTVVVSGGRAGGHTLGGSFSAQVHGYRAEAVVNVNPVTTLVELWRPALRAPSPRFVPRRS